MYVFNDLSASLTRFFQLTMNNSIDKVELARIDGVSSLILYINNSTLKHLLFKAIKTTHTEK
jgi:hypothetical protein